MTGTTPTTPGPYDFEKYVGKFVMLRDAIKQIEERHKLELAPYKSLLEELNTTLCSELQRIGAENVSTAAGTAYVSAKKAASLADKSAFWSYVVATGQWDLLDYKANVTAVEEHINQNSVPPPGVNWSTRHVAGVRRK